MGLILLSLLFIIETLSQPEVSYEPFILTDAHNDVIFNKASKELRRYFYITTGKLPEIQSTAVSLSKLFNIISIAPRAHYILLTRDDLPIIEELHNLKILQHQHKVYGQEHLIKTILHPNNPEYRFTLCVGGNSLGVIYCAYTLIETQLGVKFRLSGDIIPDYPIKNNNLFTEIIDLKMEATFDKRGIQPFHDFPEGPDWWNINEYKLHLSQMSKLKMNFIGLHTYPLLEPEVWVGTKNDFLPNGNVTKSYPTRWMTTLEGSWGYLPKITSDYVFGNSLLFYSDCYGPDVMDGICPIPKTMSDSNELFNRVGIFFKDIFSYAKTLGIETCVGTETPLSIPSYDVTYSTQDYYEGIFSRIQSTYNIDYYWIWTPEGWEWNKVNVTDPIVKAVVADLAAAQQAHDAVGAKFEMATCGWVVGPGNERTYWDQVLPPSWTITSIDMNVGWSPVDPAYKNIKNHQKWAIPWMEDDPGLSVVQLWVNRTLQHAVDANSYGCEGLLGIHWRTKEIEPQVTAMAQFSWNSTLNSDDFWIQFTADEFGAGEAAQEAANIFMSIDSFKLPRPVNWINGPGGMTPNNNPWSDVSKDYTFVEKFASIRPLVQGAANQARFDFWSNIFLTMEAVAKLECIWGEYNQIVSQINTITRDPNQRRILSNERVIPIRVELIQQTGIMFGYLQNSIYSVGTMGTVMNMEQHSLPYVLESPGNELASVMGYIGCYNDKSDRDLNGASTENGQMTPGMCLVFCKSKNFQYYGTQFGTYCFCGNTYGKYGEDTYTQCNMSCGGDKNVDCGGTWHNSVYSVNQSILPNTAIPSKDYSGKTRLIVPTARSDLERTEEFTLTALILSENKPTELVFSWRLLGSSSPWNTKQMTTKTQGRQVYTVVLDMSQTQQDFEYFINATVNAEILYFPVAYPPTPQTVIVV